MKKRNRQIIACETVINEILDFMPPNMQYQSIEPGLHLQPEKLKNALQKTIDKITADADPIILGYGLCSMAVIGLRAAKSTLVVPRIDDCIAMLLGSQRNYKAQLRSEPGTYFLSRGWIESGINLVEEFRHTEARYGKRRADIVKALMLKNYSRLAFINLGYRNAERFRQFSRKAAYELGLSYEEIEGTTRLLRRMVNGPWNDEFVVKPPGQTIRLKDFRMKNN
jgi:hypothetical protein